MHVFGVITTEGYQLWRMPASGTGSGAKGGCTAEDFTAALGEHGVDRLRDFIGKRTLVLDGASIHTSAHTRDWLAANGIKHIIGGADGKWPSHPPDLTPSRTGGHSSRSTSGAAMGRRSRVVRATPRTNCGQSKLLHARPTGKCLQI